jgi:N,N'-diacetyllegionaminate synthase
MIAIGKHRIGPGSPVFLVAEIGVNHNGREDLAMRLIDQIAETRANAVKFQAYVPEALASEVHRPEELRMLEQYVLPTKAFERLRDHAQARGLTFLCTPFDFPSLDLVVELECPAIKVGSGEMTHTPFLERVGISGRPVILSTGCSSIDSIKRAVAAVHRHTHEPVVLLHCVSTYPAAAPSLNLRSIQTLETAFPECPIGYSDHSLGTTAAVMAVALGTRMIEKHVTLAHDMQGPDHQASATIEEFGLLVREIRAAEEMLGAGLKTPAACEETIGRSLVAARDLPVGTALTAADLDYKRPGTGLRPFLQDQVLGRVERRREGPG